MRKLILFLLLMTLNIICFAQERSIAVRMDSIAIDSYSMSAKGKLNIQSVNNPTIKKITVTVMQSKRQLLKMDFSSVDEFNRSAITSRIRSVVSKGNRIMIEIGGLEIIKVLPVVD